MPDRDVHDRSKGWVKVLPWYWVKAQKAGSRKDAKRKAIEFDKGQGDG